MIIRLIRVVGMLVLLWGVLVTVAQFVAPSLLAVSGIERRGLGDRLVIVDLRTNIRHRLTWRPTITYAWEPNTGRVATIGGGFAEGTAFIYEPDGTTNTLEVYGARTLQWTQDGEQLVMMTPTLFNVGDPVSGEIEQRVTIPQLEVSVYSLSPLNDTEMIIRASPYGAAANYYSLDYETGVAQQLTNLPCGNIPYIFDVYPATGLMAYTCAPREGVRVWDLRAEVDVTALPMPDSEGSISSMKWSLDGAYLLYEHTPSLRGNSGVLTNHYMVNQKQGTIQRLNLDDWTGLRWLPLKALDRG